MSLEMKRIIKEYQDNVHNHWVEKMKSTCGFPLEIDYDWATFKNKADVEWLSSCCFERMHDGFAEICKDDFGKEALAGLFKKVVISCVDTPDKQFIELKGGALHVGGAWSQSGGYPHYSDYSSYIEKKAA